MARERYTQQLQSPRALFLLLYVADQLAGYCYAHVLDPEFPYSKKPECELEVLFLYPQFRGKGFAAEFIQAVQEWAKMKQASRIKTTIFAKNEASIRAVKKFGFEADTVVFTLPVNE